MDLFNSVWCRCLFCVCRNDVSVAKSFRIVSNCRYFHVLPCCQNNFNTFCRQSSEWLFSTQIPKRFAQTNAGNFLLMLTFSTAFGVVVCFVSVETPFQLPKVSVSSVIADILMFCLAVKIISTLFVGKAVSVCLPRKFKKRFAQTNECNFLLMLTFCI